MTCWSVAAPVGSISGTRATLPVAATDPETYTTPCQLLTGFFGGEEGMRGAGRPALLQTSVGEKRFRAIWAQQVVFISSVVAAQGASASACCELEPVL